MSATKSFAEMSGDALREAAVLVVVFGLLDKYLVNRALPDAWTGVVVGVAAVLFAVGCVLENIRRS